MRNLTVEKMNRERELEERQHRRWKLFMIFVEACWIALLICSCTVFFQVIAAHAEEQYIAVIYQDAEQAKANAITIEEAPPINRISEDLDEVDANGHQLEYLGEFTLTYYCPCRKCNGSDNAGIDGFGNPLKWGTVAVDPKVLPMHTKIVIDGYDQVFEALDTGSGVDGKHIDVFVPVSHSEALQMGQYERRKVWRWVE